MSLFNNNALFVVDFKQTHLQFINDKWKCEIIDPHFCLHAIQQGSLILFAEYLSELTARTEMQKVQKFCAYYAFQFLLLYVLYSHTSLHHWLCLKTIMDFNNTYIFCFLIKPVWYVFPCSLYDRLQKNITLKRKWDLKIGLNVAILATATWLAAPLIISLWMRKRCCLIPVFDPSSENCGSFRQGSSRTVLCVRHATHTHDAIMLYRQTSMPHHNSLTLLLTWQCHFVNSCVLSVLAFDTQQVGQVVFISAKLRQILSKCLFKLIDWLINFFLKLLQRLKNVHNTFFMHGGLNSGIINFTYPG